MSQMTPVSIVENASEFVLQKIQVNMLVRYIEAGHYEESADQYDLHSCIECGLCSFCLCCKKSGFSTHTIGKI